MINKSENNPTLFLIPTPLGDADFTHLFPLYNAEISNEIDAFFVENLRTARRFLLQLGMKTAIDDLFFFSFQQNRKLSDAIAFLKEQHAFGRNIGLLSDAGTPCVADPGSAIVAEAHRLNMKVKPLVGPNSIILALMASGLNGQSFAFNGYLPIGQHEREKELRFFESLLVKNGQTQVFIETPYRNHHLLASICAVCQPNTKLCVAIQLTTPEEVIITDTVAQWRKKRINFHKKPAIFLLGR